MTLVSKSLMPDIFFLPEWGKIYARQEKGEHEVFDFATDYGQVSYQFVGAADSN